MDTPTVKNCHNCAYNKTSDAACITCDGTYRNFENEELDLFLWLRKYIDPEVTTEKHYTGAGQAIGRKYTVRLACNKKKSPVPVIQFWDDRLVLVLNGAWVTEEAAKAILLAAKGAA